ncbi:MAG: low-complexity tail membrane protein [Cyanobacteria bacterium M_surface_10_m1_298]|nr:low-complexity tail membrane protein [Cyanobacteria bacterium M_surface_10_m1_298]
MNPARREPLLWLQLLGLAALPLEALLLFVVLAGADPGPFPGFERLLTWALGGLGPAVLFWRLPPDLWSLLLVQIPLRARRPEQLRLSALQLALPLRVLNAAGAALLLPLSWWSDAHAGLAWSWSPVASSPRLVVLLLAVPILALMQWQWAQLMQAIWMQTRPAELVEQTLPLSQEQAAEQRLNLGLPLLLLAPLDLEQRSPEPLTEPQPQAEPEPQPEPEPAPKRGQEPEPEAKPAPASSESGGTETASTDTTPEAEQESGPPARDEEPDTDDTNEIASAVVVDSDVAILPEQHAEEAESTDLDQQITGGDNIAAG